MKDFIKYVIVEEPEMGLHPQAIKSVILQVIDLMSRGYKVIISTHSPVLLEFAWAFKYLKDNQATYRQLGDLFDLSSYPISVVHMLTNVLTKNIHTYYFDRDQDEKVKIKDISALDAGSDDLSVSEWGGLSSFSSKVSDVVSKAAMND